MKPKLRVGLGTDIHRLGSTKPFMLGGIAITTTGGAIAHSDGDVLLHALCDALLGSLALGDIGDHFPPSDPGYRDMDSRFFVKAVLKMVHENEYRIVNLDMVVELEEPKLYSFKTEICAYIAELLEIPIELVSLKAKTAEGMNAVGMREAVAAQVIVLVEAIES